ncbi:TIGR04104 family putative zinc finger protein [Lysinibacillus sp. NPDC096212]|uniref:TIGR04104 family putative zinc finger protein n=1 Tax=unclassified Lysinibacillus TaxID=2636778 RepID=UPI003822D722
MSLQKCDKCNTQFKWSKIIKSLFLAYSPIQCNQCGTEHRIIFFSRIILSLLSVLPLWLLGFIILTQLSSSISYTFSIMILSGVFLFLFLLFPFFAKYKSEY